MKVYFSPNVDPDLSGAHVQSKRWKKAQNALWCIALQPESSSEGGVRCGDGGEAGEDPSSLQYSISQSVMYGSTT